MADSYLAATILKFVFSKALRISAAKIFISYERKSSEVLFALQRARSVIFGKFSNLVLLTCSGAE